jgi:hypothetical protein
MGKQLLNKLRNSFVNSTPFKKVYDIYKTSFKLYNYCKTRINIERNSHNYIKYYPNVEDTTKYKDNLKKNFSLKYIILFLSFLQRLE